MALLSVIPRWHFREGVPIREIERRTGLSRNTIRKYLRAGTVEPKFKVPARPSKLDPFAQKLSDWLRARLCGPGRPSGSASSSLMALGRPFDGLVEQTKRVSPTCLVHFERNRYSVPASFANRPVSLRI